MDVERIEKSRKTYSCEEGVGVSASLIRVRCRVPFNTATGEQKLRREVKRPGRARCVRNARRRDRVCGRSSKMHAVASMCLRPTAALPPSFVRQGAK